MIKKKALTLLVLCLMLFGLTACGADARDIDYNGYSYDDLQAACQNTVLTLEQLSPEQLQQYIDGGSDASAALVESWIENRTDLGGFIGFGDFEVTKAGKTLTAAQTVNYESRPLILTYVFNYNNMEVTDINVDLVYTTGEKMSKAGLNTIMCIAIVFAVLIVISLVISAFKLIHLAQEKSEKAANASVPEKAGDSFVEQISEREKSQNDTELIAVIAAAVAAFTGTSTDDFVVRSIRRR